MASWVSICSQTASVQQSTKASMLPHVMHFVAGVWELPSPCAARFPRRRSTAGFLTTGPEEPRGSSSMVRASTSRQHGPEAVLLEASPSAMPTHVSPRTHLESPTQAETTLRAPWSTTTRESVLPLTVMSTPSSELRSLRARCTALKSSSKTDLSAAPCSLPGSASVEASAKRTTQSAAQWPLSPKPSAMPRTVSSPERQSRKLSWFGTPACLPHLQLTAAPAEASWHLRAASLSQPDICRAFSSNSSSASSWPTLKTQSSCLPAAATSSRPRTLA
mmetsp:Transcript_460/g.828  ORF Transcript_460/g.828 Transcript_460/m.828 type:complete len:276 (+) Transcript_460:196-1023(+)